MTDIKNIKKFNFLVLLISLFLQTLVLSGFLLNYLSFNNTLSRKGYWQTTKNQLFKPASDGTVLAEQTQALATNSLDLSAWRAWNEIYLKDNLSWKTLSLEFLPGKDSYLYVIFNQTTENFSAIRISYSPLYESALVTGKYTGEFTEIIPIKTLFSDEGWQKLSIEKNSSDSSALDFWYNDQLIISHSFTNLMNGNIAFRTGKETILLDNIRVKNDQNQIIFSENFDQYDEFMPNFISLVAITSILNLVLYIFIKIRKKSFKSLVQFNFAVCIMLLAFNAVLLLSSSKIRSRYPGENALFNKIKIRNDTEDYSDINDLESEQIFAKYSTEFNEEKISRIMFIGSSQTFGEGSSLKGEDFVSQFAELIKEKQKENNGEKEFELINASIPGLPSCELFNYFEDKWIELKPDWVIVNLSINDEEYGLQFSFEDCLNELVEISKDQDYSLVFVAEAISTEKSTGLSTHLLMKEIAEENDIIFVDMQNHIAKQVDKGIIWWDFAHPTSFGHQLIANYLFEALEPKLFEAELSEKN